MLIVVLAPIIGISAQTPRPSFEVASIKKIDKPPVLKGFPGPSIRGGTVSLLGTNVVSLIQMAYGVRDFQVVGGPDWVRNDLFEVQARAPGEPAQETGAADASVALEDRFGLRLSKEQREMRFFAMVPARGDGRLGDCTPPRARYRSLQQPAAIATHREDPARSPRKGSAMTMAGFSWAALSSSGGNWPHDSVELPGF